MNRKNRRELPKNGFRYGRINNLPPKKENPEVPKKRKSVLLRLYKHRCEVAKKQGKIYKITKLEL
jgi:hypothetical protein